MTNTNGRMVSRPATKAETAALAAIRPTRIRALVEDWGIGAWDRMTPAEKAIVQTLWYTMPNYACLADAVWRLLELANQEIGV